MILKIKTTFILLFILGGVLPMYAQKGKSTIIENDKDVTISNGIVELVFPKANVFDIKSISLAGNNLLSKQGSNGLPWILTYKGVQGENPALYPTHGVYKGFTVKNEVNSKSLVFIWEMKLSYGPTYPVRMSVKVPDNSELIYWDIEADMPEGWVVTKAQFPRLALDKPDNAKIITSAGWGNEYEMKSRTYSQSYPSCMGSMQLMLMHNPQGAFYYATEDRDASGKEMRIVCGEQMVTFVTETVTSEGWTSNKTNKFNLPWQTTIGFTTEGWEAAVTKWYRPFTFTTEWGNKSLDSRNIPKWLSDKDIWVRTRGVNDSIMNAVRKSMDFYGQGLGVHWYHWHHHPYDTHYPEYFPAKDRFADMIKEVQARKCHVVPYINGRLWDPAADSYKTLNGSQASCRKADGTLYTEIYPTSQVLNTVTCPSSPLWQRIIVDLVDKIQNDLKTNGVYLDQIAAAAPQPCWAENHDHPKGGGDFWYKSYRKLTETIRDGHLKKDNILISEENSECYLDMFDVLLTVNTPHSTECKIVPLFPIVYSDRTITCAFTYTPVDGLNTGAFRFQNMQCLLYGSQLGWVEPTLIMQDGAKLEATFLKTLAEFRSKQHDVFYSGRFIKEVIPTGDNPIIDVPTFGKSNVVRATEWMTPNGQKVLLVVNMDETAHNVSLPNNKQINIKGLSGIRINL